MPIEGDPLAYYGRNIIQDYHAQLKSRLPLSTNRSFSFDNSDDKPHCLPEETVGILGAGIGGLYAALILDSLDIQYEILEASGRTGGRVSTYKFPGGGKYDYFETGAMRFAFPEKDSQGRYKNGVMKRLAELTEYGPLNEGQDRLRDNLVPFYNHSRSGSKPGFYYFNGIREPVSDATTGPFGAQEMGVDADYIQAGADAIMNDVTQPFIRMVVKDIETGQRRGWEVLKANDSYTIQSYMATKYLPSAHLELPPRHLPLTAINWCGLFGGWNDTALVQTVFSLVAYPDNPSSNYGAIHWKCFKGGSETLTKKIEEYLNKKGTFIRFHKRVTAISQGQLVIESSMGFSDDDHPADADEPLYDFIDLIDGAGSIDELPGPERRIKIPSVTVTVNSSKRHDYSHVISTLPLPILHTVDLSGAGLNVMQKNALRQLKYGISTKIAILFKTNWWTTKLGIVGGQTFTDLPICNIVYPSYGVDSSTPSKVLIASYSWDAYADRLGALATMKNQDVLKDLVLRNLAEVHGGLHPDVTYAYLQGEFVDMHVKDWNREQYTMGAFANFGPGEFQDLYTSLTYPAAGKRLHFAGEAVSTHHAWVVGALDSSWRAVYEYLKVTGQDEKMKKFKALWGENSEWANRSPFVETTKEKHGSDLLDEHLGLIDCAIRNNVLSQSH